MLVMKRYNPSEIEPKWQKTWEDSQAYAVQYDEKKQKSYVSGMFPYPSGAGMHTGHAYSYSIVDAIARFQRQHGKNVLNPMGWDTFGLPAENYAIKTGQAPSEVTRTNIDNFKKQFKRMGVSIDWTREINTTDPEYYKWTQWIFIKLYERGLAYQKESLQWWCPVDKTVLANEQVEAGKCWRCDSNVEKKSMKQWFFKITEYADKLLEEIDNLDWPQKIKTAQTNWIGRGEGAHIRFTVDSSDHQVAVFTTRPDTIFGASFLVIAPEHPLVKEVSRLASDHDPIVQEYVNESIKKSEIERMNGNREKTGVFTGMRAINPATGQKIPIWVADYVLADYGTGAIMAVPAHDERDNEFAKKFNLPIVTVVESSTGSDDADVYTDEGRLINSGSFNGMSSSEAREEVVAWLEQEGIGDGSVTYKMRDWLISRQRYWGAPIPIIHCDKDGTVPVPENDLPVTLPHVEKYEPTGEGTSVLAGVDEWVNVDCPKCGGPARRETDTMDGYACSSWYLLRYTDPSNSDKPWDEKLVNYWAPVDYYVGGDHAVAHLLYVRFWTHVFKDMGLVDFKEPVKKLVYHGYINAEDGSKMSKSKGNVIDPLDVIDQGYGADALRTYLLFMGPVEQDAPWDSNGIAGTYRFLNRIWTLVQEFVASDKSDDARDGSSLTSLQHKMIKKITQDYHRLSFNTAIASMMELVNSLYKQKADMGYGSTHIEWRSVLSALVQVLAPVAPHISEELWQQLGHEGLVHEASWPHFDSALAASEVTTIVVQVNGKLRAKLEVASDLSQDEITDMALSHEKVSAILGDKKPTKTIYVPGRLVNIVV